MNEFHDLDVSCKANMLSDTLYQVTAHNFHSGNFIDYKIQHLVLLTNGKIYNDLRVGISLFTDPLFSLQSLSSGRDKKPRGIFHGPSAQFKKNEKKK